MKKRLFSNFLRKSSYYYLSFLYFSIAQVSADSSQKYYLLQSESRSDDLKNLSQVMIIGDTHLPSDVNSEEAQFIKNYLRKSIPLRDQHLQSLIETSSSGRPIVFLYEGFSILDVDNRSQILKKMNDVNVATLVEFSQKNVLDIRGWDNPVLTYLIGSLQGQIIEDLKSRSSVSKKIPLNVVLDSTLPLLIQSYRNFIALKSLERVLALYKEKGALIVMFMGSEHVYESDFLNELKVKKINYQVYTSQLSDEVHRKILIEDSRNQLQSSNEALSLAYFNYVFLKESFLSFAKMEGAELIKENPKNKKDLEDLFFHFDQGLEYLVKYKKISKEEP